MAQWIISVFRSSNRPELIWYFNERTITLFYLFSKITEKFWNEFELVRAGSSWGDEKLKLQIDFFALIQIEFWTFTRSSLAFPRSSHPQPQFNSLSILFHIFGVSATIQMSFNSSLLGYAQFSSLTLSSCHRVRCMTFHFSSLHPESRSEFYIGKGGANQLQSVAFSFIPRLLLLSSVYIRSSLLVVDGTRLKFEI